MRLEGYYFYFLFSFVFGMQVGLCEMYKLMCILLYFRSIAVSNPRRSLPDIPSEGILTAGGDVSVYERNGDNTSDLYATVEPYHNLRRLLSCEYECTECPIFVVFPG